MAGLFENVTIFLLYLVAVANLGVIGFGYHLAELNAPAESLQCLRAAPISASGIPGLKDCIPMNTLSFSLVTSLFTLGGLIGALAGGPLSTSKGRLFPLRLSAPFFIIGSALETFATNVPIMAIGRFLNGVGAGACGVVGPIYIAEIVPPEVSGLFGSATQIFTNVGIVITQLLGYFLNSDGNWRIVLGVGGAIALAQAAGLTFALESPKWLETKGRHSDAAENRRKIQGLDVAYDVETVSEESEEGQSLLGKPTTGPSEARHIGGSAASQSSASPPPQQNVSIKDVLTSPEHRRAVWTVMMVLAIQQFAGVNAVMMYSTSLLGDILPTAAGLITVAVGVVNLIVTTACAPLPDRLGRKTCLLMSITGMGISSFLIALGIRLDVSALTGIATLTFVASFASGIGPVPFMLASELVSAEALGATQSCALAASWISTFIIAQFFPLVNNALGGHGRVFWGFATLSALFAFAIAKFVPETKGKKSIDEVWGRDRRDE